MGMSFGGLPVQCPKAIARYLGKDTAFTIARDWYGHANRMSFPLGAEPGRGVILLKKSQIDELAFDDNESFDLVITDQLRRITCSEITPVKCWCITPGHHNDPNRVYAVEIVDKRYYIYQRYHAASYNVKRAPDHTGADDYITETTNGGTAFTWEELGEELWGSMGLTSWPGWPFEPHGTPESWHFWQVPAIVAFQAVARRLGCSLRMNPYTAEFDIVRLGEDDPAFTASEESMRVADILWDEDWREPWKPIIPEKVRVIFRRLLAEADGNPYYTKDITYPNPEPYSYSKTNTRALVWDDLIHTGSNSTDLDDRADERAEDYARIVENFNARLYRHYRGVGTVSDVWIGSLCSQVSFQDIGEGVHTVVEAEPLPPVDWPNYLHGVGELVTEVQCVGNDVQETLLTTWGSRPLRFS